MSKTFLCQCTFDLVAKDGEATVSRFVNLPFAPWAGLTVVFDDDKCEVFHVRSVEWSVEHDAFWLSAGEDDVGGVDGCPCRPDDGCCVLKTYLGELLELGWELEGGPRYGEDRLFVRPWSFPSPGEGQNPAGAVRELGSDLP